MNGFVDFTLNGRPVRVAGDGSRMLLWVLRTDLGLTGTKYGCGEGHCAACTVAVGGKAVRACLTPLEAVAGKPVLTVEGLARDGVLTPLQQAFIDHGALQCGFCTPGMLMSAHTLLRENPLPTREAIVARLDHHLCRCGAHRRIVQAVQAASGQTGEGS